MKMLDCKWNILESTQEGVLDLKGPWNGELRCSARELLEDDWLSDQLDGMLEELIAGTDHSYDDLDLFSSIKKQTDESNSQLAISAMRNLINKQDAPMANNEVRQACLSLIATLLVDPQAKTLYKKIFCIFDGKEAHG